MLRPSLLIALFALVTAGACGDKESAKPVASAPAGEQTVSLEPKQIDGPSVSPVVTNNITFVAPKPGVTWAELAFPCYAAAIQMQEGASVAAPFYQASPMIQPALAAADIDLERDIAAMGGWECADSVCMYIAATLRQPKKIGDMVALITPKSEQPEPGHWKFEAPGANGARTIHIRVVPIQWGATVPGDPWSTAMAKATHVIFVTGIASGADVDPLSELATGKAATARVHDAETVLTDTSRRCVVGTTGPSDFKPGFALESSRFAMGLPAAKADPIARMMGSERGLNLEIELSLSKAATAADVTRWIEESRVWVSSVAAPLRVQFAAQGELVAIMFEAAELIATQGFRHELDDKLLRLSWRTDRVKQSSLDSLEARLQGVLGAGTGAGLGL